MKRIFGIVLAVLGVLVVLLLLPFTIHTLVNVLFVLLLGQPVPGWWWAAIGPVQNIVALPIVAFAFVIKMGPTMSLIIPLALEGALVVLGLVLLWMGLRTVRRVEAQ